MTLLSAKEIPTLDRKELEDLKANVDLVALLQEHGVDVRKQGRGFKALCPFHVERTPFRMTCWLE